MLSSTDKVRAGLNILKANLYGRAEGKNVVLSYPSGKKPYPINVSIRVTMKCNLSCTYCQVWKTEEHDRMPTEDFKSLIDQMAGMGTKHVAFSGGEPMLHPDIGEIISHAKKRGLVTAMVTNGWFMPQKVDEIKDLDMLAISIDGGEELHDRQTGKGSFQKAMKAIELAKSRGMPTTIYITMTNQNLGEFEYIIDLVKRMGLTCHFNTLMKTSTTRDGVDPLMLSPEEHVNLCRKILQKKKEGIKMLYSNAYYNYLREMKGSTVYHGNLKCFAGALYCVMNPNGDLFHCAGFVDRIKPPNARELGFKEAFNRLPGIYCEGCTYSCYINKNKTCGLNLQSLLHAWQNV